MGNHDIIESHGFSFAGTSQVLTPQEIAELRSGVQRLSLPQTALRVARPSDRIAVLHSGSGLIPVLLAGQLGVRNLAVIEPSQTRRAYFDALMADNALIRVHILPTLPEDFAPTLVISDTSSSCPLGVDKADIGNLRGIVLRLPQERASIAHTFSQITTSGLTYFPRQSHGDVVTFLSKWH